MPTDMVPAQPPVDNVPPVAVASIAEDIDDLWENMTLHFSAEGSYDDEDDMAFSWDFGDGSEGTTEPNPVHTYQVPGPVTVVLTVIDQHGVTDTDFLDLYIWRDYGDTDIIVKAVDELFTQRPFRDPWPDGISPVAVKRGGWVAYLCSLRAGQGIDVTIRVVGDRPADIHLFREADFITYRGGPSDVGVGHEDRGSLQNVTGEVTYRYRAEERGRYYVVIDNRDWPPGTDTRGPVEYSISIESLRPERDDPGDRWDVIFLVLSASALALVIAWALHLRPEHP